MEGTILSLGSINVDFQVRVDQPLGSAEMAHAHDFRRLGGGKAANVAFLARRLGHPARLLGRVGDDELAEQALAPMRAAGVDVSGVSLAPGSGTGVAMIFVPPSGQKHIVLAPDANDNWEYRDIAAVRRRIEATAAPALLVADLEVPARVVKAAAEAARRRGFPIVLDPSFPDRVDAELLGMVDAVTPNETEARRLPGTEDCRAGDLAELARALAVAGPQVVCIKRKDGGCLVYADGEQYSIAAAKVAMVDSTGAGDAFTGAFAVARLEGRSPPAAARFAVAASTAAVTGYGAQPAYPDRQAIEDLMRRQGDATRA